jgi:hypothetical protein
MKNDAIGPMVFLSDDEIDEVRSAPQTTQTRLFIAGYVDFLLQELVLFRADETELTAPLSMFIPRGGISPDFNKMEIIDHGQTIKFGSYETASTSILYDLDIEYKRYCDTNRMIN